MLYFLKKKKEVYISKILTYFKMMEIVYSYSSYFPEFNFLKH